MKKLASVMMLSLAILATPASAGEWFRDNQVYTQTFDPEQLIERIRQDIGKTARELGLPRTTLWCSEYLNSVTEGGTGSAQAKSWLSFPKVKQPRPGLIVVLKRGNSPSAGHVGVVEDFDNHYVYVLGGNQGNRVSLSRYPRRMVIAYVDPLKN